MSKGNIAVRDKRVSPVFIHSELDDLGLDPYAFRIYGRLARRCGEKGAHEALENMAKACQMSERRARQALRDLEALGLIIREERKGHTSVYWLTEKHEWRTPAPDAAPPRHEVPPTPAPGAAKGTPSKGIQEKDLKDLGKRPPRPRPSQAVAQARRARVEGLLSAYNRNRGNLPAAQTLNSKRSTGLWKLLKEHGEDALGLMVDATQCVAADDFWVERGYGLDNLLRDGRVLEKAEKFRAHQRSVPRDDALAQYREMGL